MSQMVRPEHRANEIDGIDEREALARWMELVGPSVGLSRSQPIEAFGDVVATVFGQPERLSATLRRFGRRLAVEGWALADVSGWVQALATLDPEIRGRLERFGLGLALAEGWVDGARAGGRERGCRDPLTGLPTAGVLRIRLDQVYDECRSLGIAPADAYCLIVVDTCASNEAPFVRDATAMMVAERLRATFVSGETLCATGGCRLLVLAPAGIHLDAALNRLHAALRETPLLTRVPALTWIERLPDNSLDVGTFLAGLAG